MHLWDPSDSSILSERDFETLFARPQAPRPGYKPEYAEKAEAFLLGPGLGVHDPDGFVAQSERELRAVGLEGERARLEPEADAEALSFPDHSFDVVVSTVVIVVGSPLTLMTV